MDTVITSLSESISAGIMPYMSLFIALMISFWLKDFVAAFVKGLMFRLNPTFQEGDKVILDGERALIVKIGLTQTVFGIRKMVDNRGGEYCWRYVPNDRIDMLKLEKVIYGREDNRPDDLLPGDPQ